VTAFFVAEKCDLLYSIVSVCAVFTHVHIFLYVTASTHIMRCLKVLLLVVSFDVE